MNKNKYLLGVILIVLGLILLMGSLGIMNVSIWDLIGTWWPLIIVFYGVKHIIDDSKNSLMFGSIALLFGVLLQANELNMLPMGFGATFWPLLLILVGVLTILKKKSNMGNMFRNDRNESYTEDFIEVNAIFSGVERYAESSNFQGGNIVSVFSGVKLDLRDAVIQDDFKGIDIEVVFAGVEIIVPFNWQIVAKGTPIFGGYEDKTRMSQNDLESKRVVTINYNIVFGGLLIKN
jgi:predicted membrane protein